MLSIILIGTGNVARHLFDAFAQVEGLQVCQVIGRNKKALEYFSKTTKTATEYHNLAKADIYIIALSDDAIYSVIEQLKIKNCLIVHSSGTVPMRALSNKNRAGVFYPLQTFSKRRRIDFSEVPICIEAENSSDLALLKELAGFLSKSVYSISTEQRKALHLAAVFANNFTNHMFTIANEICEEHGLPFSILSPLIRETVAKIDKMTPYEAQTGPALRKDKGTMEQHKELLRSTNQREIYTALSESILRTYGKKL
jgi:predicted short-subunit dehydrogenase-like oxidoreductase (DUF2520 family)